MAWGEKEWVEGTGNEGGMWLKRKEEDEEGEQRREAELGTVGVSEMLQRDDTEGVAMEGIEGFAIIDAEKVNLVCGLKCVRGKRLWAEGDAMQFEVGNILKEVGVCEKN